MEGWHPDLQALIEQSDPDNSTLLSIRVVEPPLIDTCLVQVELPPFSQTLVTLAVLEPSATVTTLTFPTRSMPCATAVLALH